MAAGKKTAAQGKGFGFLFEMGCGKTLTAIATMGAAYELGAIKKVLSLNIQRKEQKRSQKRIRGHRKEENHENTEQRKGSL